MATCYKCGFGIAKYDGLCERCSNNLRPPGVSCEDFYNKNLKGKPLIERFLIADDALLIYEYYKQEKRFEPLLGGGTYDYASEHEPLRNYFIKLFFSFLQERISSLYGEELDNPAIEEIKRDFFDFYRLLNPHLMDIYTPMSDFNKTDSGTIKTQQVELLLKKWMHSHNIDPTIVDVAGHEFDPGSALFYLELFVLLKKSEYLKTIEEGLIAEKSRYRDIISRPVLLLKPWEHQREAFSAWKSGGRNGILEMATATGKTLIGLMAIEDLYHQKPDAVVRIFSHSTNLLNQWRREIIQKLGIIARDTDSYEKPIKIGVFSIYFNTLQSVYKNPQAYPADLLIADEVHHLAAFEYKKALFIPCSWKMGLSATVEGGERKKILELNLGKILYQFSLQKALKDGIVPSFQWIVCPVNLSIKENEEFKEITKKIWNLFLEVKKDALTIKKISPDAFIEDLGDFIKLMEIARYNKIEVPDEWKNLMNLILQRRWIIHRSHPRLQESIKIAKELAKSHKIILFAMDIESCDYIANELKQTGLNVYVVHSKVKTDVFSQIELFKKASSGILIGARMLDEGIDIPDASIGINVAHSKTRLQIIQRMGRILRKKEGKESPVFYQYVAIPEKNSFIETEDGFSFLDDLSWVQDTALNMGLDIEIQYSDDILKEVIDNTERNLSEKYFQEKYPLEPKIGTFHINYIRNQFAPEAIPKIISQLSRLNESHRLTDKEWTHIVKEAHDKKQNECLKLNGFWWLLVLSERNPKKLISLLDPDSLYSKSLEVHPELPETEPVPQELSGTAEIIGEVTDNVGVPAEMSARGTQTPPEVLEVHPELPETEPVPQEVPGAAEIIGEVTDNVGVPAEMSARDTQTPSEVLEVHPELPETEPVPQELLGTAEIIGEVTDNVGVPAEMSTRGTPAANDEQEQNQKYSDISGVMIENDTELEEEITNSFKAKKYIQTIELCEKFLKNYPDNLYILNIKAGCEYHLGQYKEAANTTVKAIEIDPLKSILWENLGRAHSKMGNSDYAKKCLECSKILKKFHE